MEGVLRQIDVAEVTGNFAKRATVPSAFDIAAKVGQLVAVGKDLAVVGAANVDSGDVLAAQREQFVALADAVLVKVAPQPKTGEFGVAAVDFAIGVAVEVS